MSDTHGRRIVEALLFASETPIGAEALAERLPEDADVKAILSGLKEEYAERGVVLVEVGGKWMFRTAEDLGFLLRKEVVVRRKLSRAALETLAIIAYHQPVSRAEIEEVRGVAVSKGTIDVLLETGWVKLGRRRRIPGRPLTYITSEAFLTHFGFADLGDLPGAEELKAAGLLDSIVPLDFEKELEEGEIIPSETMENSESSFDENEPEPYEEELQAIGEKPDAQG
ncbi:MAG: SMC-Scp complex subunit ScpB [Hyphomicrobiales bacterium]|nr:SMC-Scp complex subunit ScpB [Hyphomicrobiales bacterium]MCY4053805.1 SMC-Scp complex subunit ScpB [Hyphomicrobiales bacterium]